MTAQELWIEVFAFETMAEFLAGVAESSMTLEDAMKAAVEGWASVFEMVAGETVESITATLVEYVNQVKA